jgi:mannosyl-3-phosphoglycerate phosphatase
MDYIIFTDLDGTLIDHDTYSYEAAMPALNAVRNRGIPLVFCTSKTRAEIEQYVEELDIRHPFISENGGAIFIPRDYFPFSRDSTIQSGNYDVIELGTRYEILRKVLEEIRASMNTEITGFGDMDDDEVSRDTGLPLTSAVLAKQRDYDEAFKLSDETRADELRKLIVDRGLNYTKGGRYWHIMGDNDKGRAVRQLMTLFRKGAPDTVSVGLGDSQNDLPMLRAVDIPFLVQKPGGIHDTNISDPQINRVKGIGPAGWNNAILSLLSSDK